MTDEDNNAFSNKVAEIKKLVEELKQDQSLPKIEAVQKVVFAFGKELELAGNKELGDLCHQVHIDLMAKIKNLHVEGSVPNFDGLDQFLSKMENVKIPEQPKRKRASAGETKRRVVVVDDDEDLLVLLQHEFHGIGFEVQEFNTGGTALEFLLKEENLHDIFLIILDRMLPDMDGLDVLKKFSESVSKKIPVLILSALTEERDIIAGLQTGAIDYVTKPFSVYKLTQKALNLLNTQNLN